MIADMDVSILQQVSFEQFDPEEAMGKEENKTDNREQQSDE